LESAGAVGCNITRDSYWFFEGGEHLRFESDLEAFGLSRPLLEGTIRNACARSPTCTSTTVATSKGCSPHSITAV
jgi:hypothetical protein